MRSTISRLRHLHMIVLRPLWAWVVGGMFALIGALALIRDELLSPEQQTTWRLLKLLPHLGNVWWVVIIAGCLVLLICEGSYRASEIAEKELSAARATLRDISLERAFDYVNMGMDIQMTAEEMAFITVTLNFQNNGDRAITYKVTDAYLEVNGVKSKDVPVPSNNVFMSAHGKRGFTFPTIHDVPLDSFPVLSRFGYTVEYDNIPPIRVRTSKRDIEQT